MGTNDNGTDNFLSPYQYKEDALSNANKVNEHRDGHIEERVQVDRRKLEQMIMGPDFHGQQNEFDEFSTAEKFFTHVMRTTNTIITWPTKLKVGAKTKKDPFVKITGKTEDVERAKKLILTMLETRHNRVTIKIDVAFTDHSHIIGKQGRNTQLAMKQTACHIHFPDSNRNPDLEKSNMVSISGPMHTVDEARRILRELAPLVINMELKNVYEDPQMLAEDSVVRELSNTANICIVVRTNRSNGYPVFIIRGSVYQENIIRHTTLSLQQRFMNTTHAICSTSMEILQQQHLFVLGAHDVNIQLISQRTGASIRYPKGDAASATTFHIHGTIDAILSARKHLVGCLPMSFVFESQNDGSSYNNFISDLEKQYGLSITLRSKRNGDSRGNLNVVVKGQERLATIMYDVRRHFVNVDPTEPKVIAMDFEFMKDFQTSVRPTAQSDHDQMTIPNAPTMPLFSQPTIAISGSMISPVPSQTVLGFSSFCSTPLFSSPPTAPTASPIMDNASIHFDSPTQDTAQPFNTIPLLAKCNIYECTNGSPRLSPNDNISSMNHHSLIHSSQNAINSNDPVPEEAPLASGLLEAAKKIQENSNNWKAPGAERTTLNIDYDQQKLMATKAMQENPSGLRIPNQQWAGLGFSRSMPAPIMRQLRPNHIDKSIDFGESSASSSSSGALQALEEDEEDKIGPWPLENRQTIKHGVFNATTYFDSVRLQYPANSAQLSETDDIVMLLSQLHLTKYVDTFREQEVDMNAFLTMTDADLKELGINTFGARRKLLVAISEIKEYRRHFR